MWFPRKEGHMLGAVRERLLCVDFFVWAFSDFPVGGFQELTGPGGCACYLAASTSPQALLLPAFLGVAAAAQKAGL